MKNARVYEQQVVIPTYRAGEMEKDPVFIEKRAYQGSTGKVYPVPICEKISETREDVTYRAVILENDYLYVMVLPELGGRIQRAYDKTNGYDFVYYNRVIKPALVGLAGPWISGGIEFNWPQHHRPDTFMPVDFCLREDPDGSASVILGDTDRINGTRAVLTITLHPDKAYIELNGRLFNPTDFPQTFLWWANPAVSVNEHTFSVFPPDVNAVMDHGKRAPSPQANTIRPIIPPASISPGTGTSGCLPPTWPPVPISTLSAIMTKAGRPACCTWRITMSAPERSNGPGAAAISERPGTGT